MQKYKSFILSYILLLTAWMLQPGKSENSCNKLKFVNLNDQNKVITAEEGMNFSVTFYISAGVCNKNNEKTLVVAVSKVDNNYIVPVCKIPFYANHTCEVSHSSEQCSCVNASQARFQVQASQSVAGVYIWSVGDATSRNVNDVNITFRVASVIPEVPGSSAGNNWLIKAAIIGGPVTFILLTSAAVACIARRQRRRRGGDDDHGDGASNPSDFDNSPAQWHPECSVEFQVVREENTYDDIMSNASQHVYSGDNRQSELPLTYLEPVYQKNCKREMGIPAGAVYLKR